MGEFVHSSNVHYAIIRASSQKDHLERLVIAYPDENCLRDLIEAPSILGLGFESREEAMANPATSSIEKPRTKTTGQSGPENNTFAEVLGLMGNHRIAHRILPCALSTIIPLFYSKNLVAATIRMQLGVSF